MGRRTWLVRAVVTSAVLAGCNAITSIGDYTFDGVDAAPDATSDGNTASSDGGRDASLPPADSDVIDTGTTPDADATITDAGTPGADADAGPCTITSPNTTGRLMVCGGTTCNLDEPNVSPPYNCCVAPDGSAACVFRNTCAPPSFNWECTRAFQCPSPSACCLTVDQITPTCPPTAHALQSRCNLDSDAGCNLDLELCTGGEDCRKPGTTCMRLDIVGTGARPLGVCL